MQDPGTRRTDPPRNSAEPVDMLPDGGEPSPAVIDRAELDPGADLGDHTIGGVVLAAGPGTRYDGPYKLLEEIDGIPIVRRAVQAMLDSQVDDVLVVAGHESEAVRDAIDDLAVETVVNDAYREGQSTSLHLGVDAARDRNWNATVFSLGDMPFVTAGVIDLVLQAYSEGHGSILAAGYDGKRGNPTLFDAEYYDDLLDVSGDTGGRSVLMSSSDVALVETDDPGVLRDIDTREDYEASR